MNAELRTKKQEICDSLLETLRKTRAGAEIEDLEFTEIQGEEFVNIIWGNGAIRRVCVSMDSGIAMIRDILKVID